MKKNQPIGIFDSGVGGLTVVKELIRVLPYENIIYYGDTARVPYGNKSRETVTKFSEENTNFLLQNNVKIVVVACNTSCSLSLHVIKNKYNVPVVGVIEPAVEKAVQMTKNNKVGVIGTRSTIASNVYVKNLKEKNNKIEVYSKSCPLFVPLVEENWLEDPITLEVVEKYLQSLKDKQIDTLILGCTHYPLLINPIEKVMGKEVSLINSAKEVAVEVRNKLKEENIANISKKNPTYEFFVSDEPERFSQKAVMFLGRKIKKAKKV